MKRFKIYFLLISIFFSPSLTMASYDNCVDLISSFLLPRSNFKLYEVVKKLRHKEPISNGEKKEALELLDFVKENFDEFKLWDGSKLELSNLYENIESNEYDKVDVDAFLRTIIKRNLEIDYNLNLVAPYYKLSRQAVEEQYNRISHITSNAQLIGSTYDMFNEFHKYSRFLLSEEQHFDYQNLLSLEKRNFSIQENGIDLQTSIKNDFYYISYSPRKENDPSADVVDDIVDHSLGNGLLQKLPSSTVGVNFSNGSSSLWLMDLDRKVIDESSPQLSIVEEYWSFVVNQYRSRVNQVSDAEIDEFIKTSEKIKERSIMVIDKDETKIRGGIVGVKSRSSKEPLPVEISTGKVIDRSDLSDNEMIIEIGRYTVDKNAPNFVSNVLLSQLTSTIFSDKNIRKVIIYAPKQQTRLYKRLYPGIKDLFELKNGEFFVMEISVEKLYETFIKQRFNNRFKRFVRDYQSEDLQFPFSESFKL